MPDFNPSSPEASPALRSDDSHLQVSDVNKPKSSNDAEMKAQLKELADKVRFVLSVNISWQNN